MLNKPNHASVFTGGEVLNRQPKLNADAHIWISLVQNFVDPIIIVLTFYTITNLFDVTFTNAYKVAAVLLFLLSFMIFGETKIIRLRHLKDILHEGSGILFSWFLLVGLLLFIAYATKTSSIFSRRVILTSFVVTPILIVVAHSIIAWIFHRYLTSIFQPRKVVFACLNDLSHALIGKINDDPYLGMSFSGVFDDREPKRLENYKIQSSGSFSDLPEFVQAQAIDIIFIALPMMQEQRILDLLDKLRDTTASIYFVPDIFIYDLIQSRIDNISGMPVLAVCETPFFGMNGILKNMTDMFLASIILILISPLLLLITVGIKLTSPGPAIFKQRRYGLDGKEIIVYKFRSMTVCEDGENIKQATRADTRVTTFGRFLRRYSLDELPQFFNVMQGRMSVVGPRPHAVVHNEIYRKLIKGYMIRHKVKPGITGLAQANGMRGQTDTLDKMQARINYDLEYLRNWSLMLDFKIIIKTILQIINIKNVY